MIFRLTYLALLWPIHLILIYELYTGSYFFCTRTIPFVRVENYFVCVHNMLYAHKTLLQMVCMRTKCFVKGFVGVQKYLLMYKRICAHSQCFVCLRFCTCTIGFVWLQNYFCMVGCRHNHKLITSHTSQMCIFNYWYNINNNNNITTIWVVYTHCRFIALISIFTSVISQAWTLVPSSGSESSYKRHLSTHTQGAINTNKAMHMYTAPKLVLWCRW